MSYYIRIDEKEDLDWLSNLISNTLNRGPNDPFLQAHYERIIAWSNALSNLVPSKSALSSTDIPDQLLSESDANILRQKSLPQPKRRGRPPGKKTGQKKTQAKRKPKEAEDPYACADHVNYSGSRAPRTDCIKCWSIYKSLNPMTYAQARSRFNLKQKKKVA
jgi:hypothetical protein